MIFINFALLAAVALCQNNGSTETTITWLAAADESFTPTLAGSVVSACSGTTLLGLACTSSSGEDPYADLSLSQCGPGPPTRTYTIGPSVFGVQVQTTIDGVAGLQVMSCAFTSTTPTFCADTVILTGGGFDTTTATTITVDASDLSAHTATITAGVEKLSNQTTCSAVSTSNASGGSSGSDNTGGAGSMITDVTMATVLGLCAGTTLLAAVVL